MHTRWSVSLLAALLLLSACATVGRPADSPAPTKGLQPTSRAVEATRPAPSPTSTPRRDARWREDLHSLVEQLPQRHCCAFFHTTEEEFERAVAELDEAIPSLSDEEIVVGMMRIVAMIGDAHTGLSVRPVFRTYPVRLVWFSDGLFVTHATPEYWRALGTRLVQVGDTDVSGVHAAVSSVIPHENDTWLLSKGPLYVVHPEVLYALGIVPDVSHGAFVFEEEGSTRFTFDLVPLPPDDAYLPEGHQWLLAGPNPDEVPIPLFLRDQRSFYWYEYLEDSRTIYVQYNRCAEMPDAPFAVFVDELFAFADSHSVDRFVVDLRLNAGGNDRVVRPLIEGLLARPAISGRGRLFGIIGYTTFSSGMKAAIDLQQEAQAILVGEPTGGKPNSCGNVASFRLPNSNLAVRYATRSFRFLDDDPPSLMPDIVVPMSSGDYFAGRDPALEAILAYEGE